MCSVWVAFIENVSRPRDSTFQGTGVPQPIAQEEGGVRGQQPGRERLQAPRVAPVGRHHAFPQCANCLRAWTFASGKRGFLPALALWTGGLHEA